jgi:regulator of protease activity HflC (stomatin/prohibitin superfamily)
MTIFVLSLILIAIGLILLAAPAVLNGQKVLGSFLGFCSLIFAIVTMALSTTIYVNDDQGGIVARKFGSDLPPNRVVAANGEKGPQAGTLGPGWHFGYWPWIYDLQQVDNMTIPQGSVGVVLAMDGQPLPGTEVFAPAWKSSEEMMDGQAFLSQGKGFRGPQLTVLTPGRYRFNPRLFTITPKPSLLVGVGEVAVIKANAGLHYQPIEGETLPVINGTALVPNGFQGIWKSALPPGAYNMHPDAYQVVKVQTTNRVYTYQNKEWAIKVRSKDGFTFPVDVRVSVSVSAEDAPYLVALLADPDKIVKDDQEDEALSILESKVILPLVRAIFRNVAESMNALQFVNSRTQVESSATARMRQELLKYKLASEGIFIGNIDLDQSEAGKHLLATQTDREVAVNEQQTYSEKMRAEQARATFIKAQEEAEQQRNLASATYKVKVAEQQALAREAEAKGEASYIQITSQAKKDAYSAMAGAIGAQGVTQLELMKLVAEGKIQITPQVMVSSGTISDALAGTILGNNVMPLPVQTPSTTPVITPTPIRK